MRTRLVHSFLGTRLVAVGFATFGAVALLNACTSKGTPAAHLDVAKVPQSEAPDQWLEQQRKLRVKYIDDVTGTVTEQEQVPADLNWLISAHCSSLSSVSDSCGYQIQNIEYNLCSARNWVAIATVQPNPLEFSAYGTHIVVDRVTEANAADAAVFGGEYARYALRSAMDELAGVSQQCKPGALWLPYTVSGRSGSVELAARAVEAYYLAMSAADRAVEATSNVSDAARSSSLSPGVSLQRSILAQSYSRAAAAHMLVGGDDGLLGSLNTGYCSAQQLAPKAQAALQLLRDAAPSPSMLAGDVNVLVNGTTSGNTNGSVRERLGAFYKLADLKAGKRADLYYGLTIDDFTKARDYLNQEIGVFNRSPSALSPAPQPDATGYYRFAGTGGDRVQALPAGAWAARARYTLAHSRWYDDSGNLVLVGGFDYPGYYIWDPGFRPTPLENLVAGVQIRARNLLKSPDSFSTTTTVSVPLTPEAAEVKGILASIITGNDYTGMLDLSGTTSNVRGVAYGYTTADKVRVVVGEDGLRCAVDGTIEGVPCLDTLTGAQYNYPASAMPAACQTNPATLSCLTVHALTKQSATTLYGMDVSVGGDTAAPNNANGSRNVNTSDLTAKKTRLYFVKLKTQGSQEKPGAYELLGGAPFLSGNLAAIAVTPNLQARVADVLAPSRKNCAIASTTCMYKEFDARLPLEDELASDGNNVENSWRHYLDLAKQAAQESSAIGQEFQQLKLNNLSGVALASQRQEEKRQAADSALEVVQQLCGTAIDNRSLLSYFSGSDQSGNLDNIATIPTSACANGATCPGSSDTVCMSGMCVKDPAKLTYGGALANDPDAKKLADCLGGAVEKFVTLGDTPLCVYVNNATQVGCALNDPANLNSLPPGVSCPDVVNTTDNSDGSVALACKNAAPTGFTGYVAKPLGYFHNAAPSTGGSAACVDFRRARKSRTNVSSDPTHNPTPLDNVINSPVFFDGRFSDTVGRLGYVAKYGGYVEVTEDGSTRWSSGNMSQGRTNGWPHVMPAECAAGDQVGLFCTTWPANPTAAQLADMNTRIFEATLGASAIRAHMDKTKAGMDIYFPSSVNYDVDTSANATTTATTVYQGGVNPVRETRAPLKNKPNGKTSPGTKTTYAWLNGTDIPNAWTDGLGAVYGSAALNWYGPKNPDPKNKFDDFVTSLNDGYFKNNYKGTPRAWLFEVLAGHFDENSISSVFWDNNQNTVIQKINTGGGIWSTYSGRAFVDGYELLCELDRAHSNTNGLPPALGTSPTDVEQTGAYLQSLADKMEAAAASLVIQDVPVGAFSALSSSPQSGDVAQLGGEMGQAVTELRNAMISVRQMTPIIAAQLKQIKTNLEALRAKLDSIEAHKDINELDKWSASLNNAAACASSFSFTKMADSFGLAQAATCANAIAQTAITFKKTSLEERILNNDATLAKAEFAEQASQHAELMQVASLGLETAIENTKAATVRMAGLRKRAAQALAKSLYLASYQSADQVRYDTAVGALTDVTQTRYIAALKNAKLMAFLARRAIEQRLGVNLIDMREDLALVDAPASWEGEACSLNGIQLDDPGSNAQATAAGAWVATYGQSFIGDYVTKLENVVESYRLQHPFHEGQDTAVVSLRDDVLNVRTECSMPGRNLFKYSADLSNAAGWGARGCLSQTVNSVVYPALNCVQAVPSPDYVPTTTPPTIIRVADLAAKGLRGNAKGAQGYILRFGDGQTTCTTAGNCGWLTGSALSQVVDLGPGKYRLSWYTRDLTTASNMNASKVGIVVARKAGTTTQNPTTANFVAPFADGDAGDRWKRATIEITIPVAGSYEIGFGITQATMPTAAQEVTVGGVMLDSIPPSGSSTYLPSFQSTDGEGNVLLTDCEDKTGSKFQASTWSRQCMHLCSDGFSGNCTTGPKYCYREFSFGINQPWLATGKLFKYSGFARGNYNYRIDSLALNFVGSAARDCSNADLPDTCYNAGFIPYSILHTGPFYTRNQAGADVEALIFDGKIEHARGLALERYVTNPISSTDKDLLGSYTRNEFAGRPLDGNFTVRMWEEPGVNLDGVEDVQLVLNYRYWTANE